jgi:hypothetical protein
MALVFPCESGIEARFGRQIGNQATHVVDGDEGKPPSRHCRRFGKVDYRSQRQSGTLDGNVKSNFGGAPNELVTKTTLENGHGRIETRSFTACGNVAIVSDRHYREDRQSAR